MSATEYPRARASLRYVAVLRCASSSCIVGRSTGYSALYVANVRA